jgi:hypothetical protein
MGLVKLRAFLLMRILSTVFFWQMAQTHNKSTGVFFWQASHMQNKNLRAGQLFNMLLIVAMWERFDQRVVQSLVDRLGKLGFWDNLVSPGVHHTVRQV